MNGTKAAQESVFSFYGPHDGDDSLWEGRGVGGEKVIRCISHLLEVFWLRSCMSTVVDKPRARRERSSL